MRCRVGSCGGRVKARGWCAAHYDRWLRHGDVGPEEIQRAAKDPRQRIRERTIVCAATGCWIWQGTTVKGGYGLLRFRGQYVLAHRLAFEAFNGPIPDGHLAMHECDNPPCCNPGHLVLGTPLANTADMVAKGRAAWQR